MTLLRRSGRLTPLAAALLALGCATPDHGERRVRYSCDDGGALTVVFARDIARLYSGDGLPIELARRQAASGFAYGSGPHSIHGEGSSMTYLVGRRAPIVCTEVGAPS
jgi:membrane-bound inhibitor of C-type lysozyme